MSAKRIIQVVAAVIEHNHRYLVTQRTASAVFPLLWEFPGGRIEDDETDIDALQREVEWRVGIEIIVGDKIGDHVHEYHDYDVHLSMYGCKVPGDIAPTPVNVKALRWVTSAELRELEFPPADEKSMSKMLGLVRN